MRLEVKIINGNPYVDLPQSKLAEIFQQADKHTSPIPVRGTIDGAEFTQTLVKYEGAWRLYINMIMAKAAGIKYKGSFTAIVGMQVDIEVEFDPDSRKLPMHPQLAAALSKDKKAKTAYDALAPYRKHEILRYLGFLKSEASIDRNIVRILQHLRGEESDALYPLMHRKKGD